jgi:hypothetical protein
MRTDLTVIGPPHRPMQYSLYRLTIKNTELDRFHEIFETIRPGENKLTRIEPTVALHRYDIILNREELMIFVLGCGAQYSWLQEWEFK